MKVLVTGVSGFIGSHVARALIKSGHNVLGLVSPDDNLWRLADLSEKIEIVKGNLGNIINIRDSLRVWQPQVCIHLAWCAKPGAYLNSRENLVSLDGSLSLLQLFFESGGDHFIGAGTCAEYEMKPTLLSETDPANPETLYAATKLSLKIIGKQIALQYNRLFSWGRIFYLYGPFEDERRLIPAAMSMLHKKNEFPTTYGAQVRDYLYVEDVAAAFIKIAEMSMPGTYNVSSGVPITIREVLIELIKVMDRRFELIEFGKIPYPTWNPMYICGDNKRLKALGWRPKYDLAGGLAKNYQWWLDRNLKETGL